ncbi:nitroreductase family protein [Sedimentibacter sp. zth1]|uniref:nitroreductase family protein n=1 Tax=Sedimentibacter sp. zth1 TaxID=2816908 RepID=UPI001F5FD707|nr:nitroreductase family protein [Sedimentibacter sp. zth1]
MNTLDAIYNRRSIRQFTDEAVGEEQIDILLHAAFSAPTVANAQPLGLVPYGLEFIH